MMIAAVELKQFVPSEICLKCDGCCRFRQQGTCWQPKMSAEERAAAAARISGGIKSIPPATDPQGSLPLIAYQDIFICNFFSPQHNTCGIYHARPFECRLYPFLLVKSEGQISVGAHLLCPYIQEKKDTPRWEQYVLDLREFFRREDVRAFLGRNPLLAGDYKDGADEIEHLFTVARDIK